MKNFRNLFFKNNNLDNSNIPSHISDQYEELGKLVKEARVKNNLSVQKLSEISKIPESSINAIENNIKHLRPKYPFIRSILLKLEVHLSLKKNSLIDLSGKENYIFKNDKTNYIIRKFDFLNSWHGSLIYFLVLILMLFIINSYFISNSGTDEFLIIEEQVKKE